MCQSQSPTGKHVGKIACSARMARIVHHTWSGLVTSQSSGTCKVCAVINRACPASNRAPPRLGAARHVQYFRVCCTLSCPKTFRPPSPYPQNQGPAAQHYGLSVVFTIQANNNNDKNTSQSPIAKGLHRIAQQRHTIPHNASLFVRYDIRRTHGIFKAMHTTKTSAGSNKIGSRWLVSPHTDCYLVPGLNQELQGRDLQRATNDICMAHGLQGRGY